MADPDDLVHVAHLAKQFGKLRSFALESLLHAALTTMDGGLNASTGHTLDQNIGAMGDLLQVIRQGDMHKGLEPKVFAALLAREDVDGGVVADAEDLHDALRDIATRIDRGDRPAATELDGLFETYTAFRIRTSGFLRQVEHLAEVWRIELEQSAELRHKIASTISELEQMSGAINILSINASVEASRARDEGAAFRVIAHEMQRLSTQSSGMLKAARANLGLR